MNISLFMMAAMYVISPILYCCAPNESIIGRSKIIGFQEPACLILPEREPRWGFTVHQLPAAYYLVARFHDDFESAVLHPIIGGGQNQARAMLTGALVGHRPDSQAFRSDFWMGWRKAKHSSGLPGISHPGVGVSTAPTEVEAAKT